MVNKKNLSVLLIDENADDGQFAAAILNLMHKCQIDSRRKYLRLIMLVCLKRLNQIHNDNK